MVVEKRTRTEVVGKMAGNMVDSMELVGVALMAGQQLQDQR